MTDGICSGFSFLSSKGANTDNNEIEPTDFNIEKSRKLTDTSDLSADNYESSMLGLPISMPQDIKIFKSSAAKFVKKKKRVPNRDYVRGGNFAEDDGDETVESVVYDSSLSVSDGNSQTGSDLSDHLSPEEIITTDLHQIALKNIIPLPENLSAVSDDDVLHTVKDNSVFSDPTLDDKEIFSHQFRKRENCDSSRDIRDDVTINTSDSDEVPVYDVYSIITVPIAHSMSEELSSSSAEEAAAAIPESTTRSPISTPILLAPSILSIHDVSDSMTVRTSEEQVSSTCSDSLLETPQQPVTIVISPAVNSATTLSTESRKESIIPVELNEPISSAGRLFVNEKTLPEDCRLKTAGSSSSKKSRGTEFITSSSCHNISDLECRIGDSEYIEKIRVISVDFATQAAQLSQRRIELTKDDREMRAELQCAETWLTNAKAQALAMEDDQLRLAALEEFDEAHALTDALESLQREISVKTKRCGQIGKESLLVLQVSLEDNRRAQAIMMKDVIIYAATAMEQEQNKLSGKSNEKNDIHLQEEERLKREKERIDLENSYTCEEENSLSEQTIDLEKTIVAQIGDTLEKKALLEAQSSLVANEIIKLETLLNLKKAEEDRLKIELLGTNEKISQVRSKFQRQLQHVEDRRALLEGTRRSCGLDQEALELSRKILDDELCAIDQSRVASLKWCHKMSIEVDYLNTIKNVLFSPEECSPTVQNHNDQEGHRDSTKALSCSDDVQDLLDHQTCTGEAFCAAVKEQLDLSFQGQSLQAELREIQDMGIRLEADKKALAANRRFKEAAIVAKDEKANFQRREELEILITAYGIEATEKLMEIKLLEETHHLAVNALKHAKQHVDMVRHAVLRNRLKRLKKVYKSVRTTLSSGGECNGGGEGKGYRSDVERASVASNTQSSSDIETSLAATALILIQAEIQELIIEAEYIEENQTFLGLVKMPSIVESDDDFEESSPSLNGHEVQVSHLHDDLESTLDASSTDILESKYSADDVVESSASTMSIANMKDTLDSSDIDLDTFADVLDESVIIQETQERRNYLISLAKDNVQEFASLDAELQVATNVENYELADVLDGRMNVIKKTILQLLRDLCCSEEDIKSADLGGLSFEKLISGL